MSKNQPDESKLADLLKGMRVRDEPCSLGDLQAIDPAVDGEDVRVLYYRKQISGGLFRDALTGRNVRKYVVTPAGREAIRANRRAEAASANEAMQITPPRRFVPVGPYVQNVSEIARADANDYLEHPSRMGDSFRVFDLAANGWRDKVAA